MCVSHKKAEIERAVVPTAFGGFIKKILLTNDTFDAAYLELAIFF